jgi:atypical dual specificity phosphatase
MYNQFFTDYDKITDRIYLGNIAGAQNKHFLDKNNIGYVINLSNQSYDKYPNISYLNININDTPDTNIKQHFKTIFDFFNKGINSDKNIYIHCKAGISRSSSALIAYLMTKGLDMKTSINYVISRRKIIEPNDGFWLQLIEFEKELYGKNSVDNKNNYY